VNDNQEVSELAALTRPGSSYVPPPQPELPADDPAERRVIGFLKISRTSSGMTLREIAGGSALAIAAVRNALERLVAAGAVRHDDASEVNYRRYLLTATPVQVPPPPAPEQTADERWSTEQRRRALDAEANRRAPEPKAYSPSEADITAALEARKVKPLSDEERKQLELGAGRVPINPQIAIRK
jgi:hypothetical protein